MCRVTPRPTPSVALFPKQGLQAAFTEQMLGVGLGGLASEGRSWVFPTLCSAQVCLAVDVGTVFVIHRTVPQRF